jgi:hypothetical protein
LNGTIEVRAICLRHWPTSDVPGVECVAPSRIPVYWVLVRRNADGAFRALEWQRGYY